MTFFLRLISQSISIQMTAIFVSYIALKSQGWVLVIGSISIKVRVNVISFLIVEKIISLLPLKYITKWNVFNVLSISVQSDLKWTNMCSMSRKKHPSVLVIFWNGVRKALLIFGMSILLILEPNKGTIRTIGSGLQKTSPLYILLITAS